MQKHKMLAIFLILVLLMMCIYKEYDNSKYHLITSHYQINNQLFLRIVQITDLHNSEFGENNNDLVNTIENEHPDMIFITGDLINSNNEDTTIATTLIKQLSQICDVYISYGNHEIEYEENYGIDIKDLYEEAGGIVLEREYVDLTINDQNIRIGGIYGYCLAEKYLETNEADEDECAFLSAFQDTSAYTILLCHMPVCWIQGDSLEEWDIDCIFSGHVHGGQIIIPFIGGFYAPDFGFFPGKLQGLFESDDGSKVVVLSTGLGSNEWIPRFNNDPEVVVVDMD
ncbi:MAG: metallophosphoesterase [Erysipelotrichaceae bacterium]|nr:metallophosphoesterase [Erysipelotrichaceae bacterium]